MFGRQDHWRELETRYESEESSWIQLSFILRFLYLTPSVDFHGEGSVSVTELLFLKSFKLYLPCSGDEGMLFFFTYDESISLNIHSYMPYHRSESKFSHNAFAYPEIRVICFPAWSTGSNPASHIMNICVSWSVYETYRLVSLRNIVPML